MAGGDQPGARYRCVKRSAIRADPDLASERTAFLEVGEELQVLESRVVGQHGLLRVRCDRGWVSTNSATGAALLELLERPAAAGEGGALPPPAVAGSESPADGSQAAAGGGGVEGGSMEALDELLVTMRQMEGVLQGKGQGPGAAEPAPDPMGEASRLLADASYAEAAAAFGAMLAADPNDESAARGLRQAEKGLKLTQQQELEAWLGGLGLDAAFAWGLAEHGFADLSRLQAAAEPELAAVLDAVGMDRADASTLRMALGGVAPVSEERAGQPQGLMRGASSSRAPIAGWLAQWQLPESIGAGLAELGVDTVGDLQALDADDIAELRRPLKKVQAKKFVQALAQALDDVEREFAEQERERAHEEAGRLRREHAAALMGRAAAPPTPTRGAAAAARSEGGSDGEEREPETTEADEPPPIAGSPS